MKPGEPRSLIFTMCVCALYACTVTLSAHSATSDRSFPWDPVFYLNKDESTYIRLTSSVQVWLRQTDLNPGSHVSGTAESEFTDLSIRRFRLGLSAVPFEKAFIRLNFGFNNLNLATKSDVKVELLDGYVEYRPAKFLEFGAGKSAWTGPSRYAAPSTVSTLMLDLPIVALPTLNVTDNLLRHLGVYLKGQVNKLDYRLSVFKPDSVEQHPGFDPTPEEGIAKFRDEPSGNTTAFSGYLKWQFFDHENNNSAFSPGTYLGERKVMTLGFGYEVDTNRSVHLENGEPVFNDLKLMALDFFLDLPLEGKAKNALTVYAAYFDYDYGPNLIRNIGVNNIATIDDPDLASFNGPGNAFPLLGTGESFYLQAGYLMGPMRVGRLQPYFSIQYSNYERLSDAMVAWNIGANWLLRGHSSKLSMNLESRPVFHDRGGKIVATDRKLMFVIQYQISI